MEQTTTQGANMASEGDPIVVNETTAYFSNKAIAVIELDSTEWHTVEHYFQAQKITNFDNQEVIRNTPINELASVVSRIGNSDPSWALRDDWEHVKSSVMTKGVLAKFKQNPTLKEHLLKTGTRTIIAEQNDAEWKNDEGVEENKIGQILMAVRQRIRPAATDDIIVPKNDVEEDEVSDEGKPLSKAQKEKLRRRRNARSRKGVWRDDIDKSSIVDKTRDGKINIVGTNIKINYKALPPAGRIVVNSNQYIKRFQNEELDDDYTLGDSQDDIDLEKPKQVLMSDFLPDSIPTMPSYFVSSDLLMIEIQETINQIEGLGDDPNNKLAELTEKCQQMKPRLTHFITKSTGELEMNQLLISMDRLNTVLC